MPAHYHLLLGRRTPSAWIFSLLLLIISAYSTANSAPINNSEDAQNQSSDVSSQLTKLDSAGVPVSFDSQKWSCVADDQTDLMWEKRDPTTALHGNDTFIWYQPEHIDSGSQRAHPNEDWADSTCFGFNAEDPSSYCNTNAYTDRVNQSNYCGFSDWRLPTAKELLTLVDAKRKQDNISPLIDTRYFPFHNPFLYWTNTVDDNGVVATIFADDQVFANSERTDSILIRLVRENSY